MPKSKTTSTKHIEFHTIANDNLVFECVNGREVVHDFPSHVHHSLCIGLITGGMRRMAFSDSEIRVQANELFVINPLQSHAVPQQLPHDYIVLSVKGLPEGHVFQNHILSLQTKQLFLNLWDALQGRNWQMISVHWKIFFVHLCLYQCKSRSMAGRHPVIERTMAYVATHYQNPITVSELAKHNCMSVFHFCRTFKSLMGISPHKYLIQYRLSMSCKILRGDEPIFDAAIHSGFFDSSHYIRTFYNLMATSPKSYQQSVSAK